MGAIFSQLGQLFLRSIPTVILVFALFVFLDRFLFHPLIALLKQREESTVGALARAREQGATAEAKAREYDTAIQAARQEVYRQREADRRKNLEQREEALRKGREQAEILIRDGQAELAREVSVTKTELTAASQSLAEEISQNLLGTESPSAAGGRFGV
jgi:F-type H+-transporting ATPase subunit b